MLYSRHSHAGGMLMELTDSLKTLLIETAKSLKGSARRLFMARTVKELGPGGQQRAARALRWGRMTIRKGMHELDSMLEGLGPPRRALGGLPPCSTPPLPAPQVAVTV